jgi:hypothetical protein
MKYMLALCALTTLSVYAYTGFSNVSGPKTISAYPPDSTYSGDGLLSYTVEGRKVNIKTTLHTDGKNFIALYINEVDKKDGAMVRVNLTNYLTQEVVNFFVADKGTTHILHYTPSFTNGNTAQGEFMLKYNNYYAEDATVQITALDNAHVAGTFSGKFISHSKKTIQIINGSFDVPYKSPKIN